MVQTDLIIIGAGPGGYETAVFAAHQGLKVVIVEEERLGGTCLQRGCIPTKCFCKNAEVMRTLKHAAGMGVTALSYQPQPDMAIVLERKNTVVQQLTDGIAALMRHPNITLVYGKARFAGNKAIEVADAHNAAGESCNEVYCATNIIVATGSVTKFLPIEGAHSEGVYTSTELLNIDFVPQRLCVIGGGVIGLEFASIFNAFGSEVTVLEYCKEVLPNFDTDIAKRLKAALKSEGINIINNAAVNSIAYNDGISTVGYDLKGAQQTIEADVVLMAVGRAANIDSLNFADAKIETTPRGVVTDNNFMTSVSGIYAIGDINGKCQLAHAASFQGKHVIQHILGKDSGIDFSIMPAAVFTMPEAAMVGITTEAAKAQGIAVKAHKAFFRANGKALAMNESDGIVKILATEDETIVGAHLYGPHAAELAQQVANIMNQHATLTDVKRIIHAHPTLGEVVLMAAEA